MIEKHPFGRTGHLSTATIFGGAVLKGTQADADRVLDLLLEHGINHIDTANSYGDSESRSARGWTATGTASSWRPRRRNAPTRARRITCICRWSASIPTISTSGNCML